MNRCRWQGVANANLIQCGNTQDMLHNGVLPLQFCQHECPYRKPADFWTDTAKLLQSSTYTPPPKSCGGCGTVKRRDTATQFVWPYWHAGASGDELRYSVRSVEKHFQGEVKTTIVGDRPPWYRGHVIHAPQIKACKHHGFRDMLAKMWVMATHAEIDPEFVWIMDDVYLLKPVTWDDLATPLAYPWREDVSNDWQRRKSETMAALRAKGLPNHDYATHLPHCAEKAKLKALFSEFDLHNKTLLWEVLYNNRHHGRPYSTRGFFARLMHRHSIEQLREMLGGVSVMNHLAEVWSPQVRQYLEELLPEPASSEIHDSGYRPTFRKAGRGQPKPVKRRPPNTWRKNNAALHAGSIGVPGSIPELIAVGAQ